MRSSFGRRRHHYRRHQGFFRRLRLEPLEGRLALAILTVNSLADGPANFTDTTVTLRDAIEAANTDVAVSPGGPTGNGADEIQFAAGLSDTITLDQGQLQIRSDLTITGLGANLLTITANNMSRVINVTDSTATFRSVTISGLTITGGSGTFGGGISNAENLTVDGCVIRDNHGLGAGGGGIGSSAELTVLNSTISGNQSDAAGGGILSVAQGGTGTRVANSTISGNSARTDGGGIGNGKTNASASGLYLQNTTITANHSDSDDNATGLGGGVWFINTVVAMHNTIVADNFGGSGTSSENDIVNADNAGLDSDSSNNLIGTGGSGGLVDGKNGNQVGVADPKLGALADNGGPTKTHALLGGSPAVNAGDNSALVYSFNFDQRGDGFPRIAEGIMDIGAFEAQPISLVVDIKDDIVNANTGPGDLSLREAISLANTNAASDTITFAPALVGKTILLTLDQLSISDTLTIQGPPKTVTIDGRQISRLFDITSTAKTVTFDGLKLTGGKTTANSQSGGAIRSASTGQLTITNCTLSGNSTTGNSSRGGAVSATGPVVVKSSTIAGNTTAGTFSGGAGIYTDGTLTLTDTTVSGNSTVTSSVGGGLSAGGTVTIANSTISGNSTTGNFSDGGGIFGLAAVVITDSTITGNSMAGSSTEGGGVFSAQGPVTIKNSIIAGNFDMQDGSNPDLLQEADGVPALQFSIIGDNNGSNLTAAPLGAPDANHNLIGTHTSPINPQLAPLANNGGPMQTHALCTAAAMPVASCTAASPAIDAGTNTLVPADTNDLDHDGDTIELIPFDQRGLGFVRFFNSVVDIGAFEVQVTFPWHNFVLPDDVVGDGTVTPDGFVVAGDVIAIINYINAHGSGPIPANSTVGLPFGFLDTKPDNQVVAEDVLTVINYINAGRPNGGEAPPETTDSIGKSLGGVPSATWEGEAPAEPPSPNPTLPSDLLLLLAADLAMQPLPRRLSRA